ncbi:hypothetical protein [Halalkalibacter oceani]|uniref:hypothetical protein n=1 Tax=Halalkalibacter oceani TaxID=1653776 RepID=UPI0033964C69
MKKNQTKIKFYRNGTSTEIELDKDEKVEGFVITEAHLDLNNRISNTEFDILGVEATEANSFQDAVDIYNDKFNEYEKKSFDWKGYSAGCLKFYWSNEETDVLTYLKLNYNGEEVMDFDFEELGFL